MKKALIFYGGWDGHTPKETGFLFKGWLEENGVDVTMSDSLTVLEDLDYIRQFDLFVPIWTMGQISPVHSAKHCPTLTNYGPDLDITRKMEGTI